MRKPSSLGAAEHVVRNAAGDNPAALSRLLQGWMIAGGLTILFSVALTAMSDKFGYAFDVIDMPVLTLVALLVGSGAAYAVGLPRLIAATEASTIQRLALNVALVAGLTARLVLFASEPILEDDYQRYLWDGAVSANGHNPYARSPLEVLQGPNDEALRGLAAEAGPVLSRINHKPLTTIYPPIAQATFALAHLLGPWKHWAWRAVLLSFDCLSVGLLILLLETVGRARLWCTLYWLNPVVLKEVFNSMHMDAVVLPFVLLALLLSIRRRPFASSFALSLATGAKFWPALLLPFVLRTASNDKTSVAGAILIFASMLAIWAWPMLERRSGNGLSAYAGGWQVNSVLFPAIRALFSSVKDVVGSSGTDVDRLARLAVAFLIGGLVLYLARQQVKSADDLVVRSSSAVGGLLLTSPALYPWYTVWMAPFLSFRPDRTFLLLTVLIPLYYLYFYFAARGMPQIFESYVVLGIWIPVWTAILIDIFKWRLRRSKRTAECAL